MLLGKGGATFNDQLTRILDSLAAKSRVLQKFVDKKEYLIGLAAGKRLYSTDTDEHLLQIDEIKREIAELKGAVGRLSGSRVS